MEPGRGAHSAAPRPGVFVERAFRIELQIVSPSGGFGCPSRVSEM